MSDFPLLWFVTYAYSYSSMKDKYPILYARSSSITTTLKLTDKNE